MSIPLVELADCCDIISGATPSTTVRSYWNGDIHWATPKDLSELDSHYIAETAKRITAEGLASCAASVLPPHSVLFSSRAPIGHVAVNTVPMATNQGFKSLIPKKGRADAKYLFHWLKANRHYLESLGNGATFKELSKSTISRVQIPLPDLATQHRIAAILDLADTIRAKRREALAQLDRLGQAIFIDMFGDPATNPMRWPQSTLGELGEVQGGLQLSGSRSTLPLEAPYLRVANVYRDRLELNEVKTFHLTPVELARTRLIADDILIVEGHGNPDEIGRCAVWDGSIADCSHQNHLIRLRVDKERTQSRFVASYLNSTAGRRGLQNASNTTSGLNTISVSKVRDCQIFVPPLELQNKFSSCLEAVQAMRQALQRATEQDNSLMKSLQHRAFRGEL